MNAKKAKALRRVVRDATIGAPSRALVRARPGARTLCVHPKSTRGVYLALKRTEG